MWTSGWFLSSTRQQIHWKETIDVQPASSLLQLFVRKPQFNLVVFNFHQQIPEARRPVSSSLPAYGDIAVSQASLSLSLSLSGPFSEWTDILINANSVTRVEWLHSKPWTEKFQHLSSLWREDNNIDGSWSLSILALAHTTHAFVATING